MTSLAWRRSHWIGVFILLLTVFASPGEGQYPAPECAPLVPAPAPDDPSVLTYCTDNPDADCDLAIESWNPPASHRSPAIRIGDPLDTLSAEQPRVFLDPGNPAVTNDDRLYTKLYTLFRNVGGGAGGGGFAAAGDVRVHFAYKEVANAAAAEAAAADPNGWIEAGTVTVPGPSPTIDNTYLMDIPSPGILSPGLVPHVQQRGVCWTLDPEDADFPKKFVLRARLDWSPDEDSANDTAFSFYDLTQAGRRAQIAFALDLSGSMSLPFEGSTRLIVATQKAALFTSLIENDDQLGVFGFATGNPDNTSFNTTYNSPATPSTAFGDTSQIAPMQTLVSDFQRGTIAGLIGAQRAHGCTPVGQGLLRARHAIQNIVAPPGSPAKAIVLFSDGVQNVRPFVNVAPGYDCGGGVAAPVIDTVETFADEGIQIYSVHFGPEVGWAYNLMNDLKNQTGGDYIYGTADELELAVAYFSIRGLVDDMIFLREDGIVSTGPDPVDSTFEVEFDAAAQTATAAVTWPHGSGDTRLALDRRMKGHTEWLPCRPGGDTGEIPTTAAPAGSGTSGSSYLVCRFTPGAESTWEFRVRQVSPRRGSTRFAAAVFSLVQTAEIHPSLDDDRFTAGDALTIRTELRTAGQPLTGATVTADVRVPARSFSTTLYRHSDRLQAPPNSRDSSRVTALARQLSSALVAEGETGDLYPTATRTVKLTDDGQGADQVANDGHYTGVLPGAETRVAGLYDVTVTARATLAGGKDVERIARLSTVADVARPDPQASVTTVTLSPDLIEGARVARVTVVPFDRFGNAAFPGSGSRISFRTKGATPRGDLVDHLDATYTRSFRLDRPDATVTVLFDDEPVATDLSLSGGPTQTVGRELSFHAGVANPHGSFGSVASSGPSFALDYAWRFGGPLAVKAELAYDDFDSDVLDDSELTSLAVYLQHRWAATGWQPYFEAGLGGYELDGSTAFGTAIGLGARWQLAPQWSFDANAQHHWVGGSLSFNFSRVRVGLVYDF